MKCLRSVDEDVTVIYHADRLHEDVLMIYHVDRPGAVVDVTNELWSLLSAAEAVLRHVESFDSKQRKVWRLQWAIMQGGRKSGKHIFRKKGMLVGWRRACEVVWQNFTVPSKTTSLHLSKPALGNTKLYKCAYSCAIYHKYDTVSMILGQLFAPTYSSGTEYNKAQPRWRAWPDAAVNCTRCTRSRRSSRDLGPASGLIRLPETRQPGWHL